jgi:hypothetical protein
MMHPAKRAAGVYFIYSNVAGGDTGQGGSPAGIPPAAKIDLLHKSPFLSFWRGIKGEVNKKVKIYARGLI